MYTKFSKVSKRVFSVALVFAMALTTAFGMSSNASAAVKTKKITLSATKKTLNVGAKFTLKVKKVKPAKASKKVAWKSSDKKVATVTAKGVVAAKKAGSAKITATSKTNKKVKATCTVTVKAVVTPSPSPVVSATPTVVPSPTATAKASPTPTKTPRPTPEPTPTLPGATLPPAPEVPAGYVKVDLTKYTAGGDNAFAEVTANGLLYARDIGQLVFSFADIFGEEGKTIAEGEEIHVIAQMAYDGEADIRCLLLNGYTGAGLYYPKMLAGLEATETAPEILPAVVKDYGYLWDFTMVCGDPAQAKEANNLAFKAQAGGMDLDHIIIYSLYIKRGNF